MHRTLFPLVVLLAAAPLLRADDPRPEPRSPTLDAIDVDLASARLKIAQTRVQVCAAHFEQAKSRLARLVEAGKQGGVNPADVDNARFQVEEAKAELDGAQAGFDVAHLNVKRAEELRRLHAAEARRGVDRAEAHVKQAEADLRQKRATLELAEANFKRAVALSQSGGISNEELRQREGEVKQARAALERGEVDLVRAKLDLDAARDALPPEQPQPPKP